MTLPLKWSIDRVMSLDLDPSWLVSAFVDHVEVLDTLTVSFILKMPVAFFLAATASTPYFPVSPKSYPVDATAEPLVGHYGPYKIKSWTRDIELVLEANPDYYGAQPRSKYVVIKFFADAASMRQALEGGEIDIAWKTLRSTDIVDLKENPDFNIVETPGPYIRYIVLRCNMTPFDDVRLRRAVAAAINRTRICTEAYMGTVEPLYSMVPMGMWSHIDAFKDEYGARNLTLARELLTAAGYGEANPFTFDLWYTPTHYGDQEVDVAAIIKANLEETGMMEVTLKSAEWATYAGIYIPNGVMPIFLLGWYPDFIDPDDYLTPFVYSEYSGRLGVFYNSTEMDTLLLDVRAELNITRRTELYEDAQRLLAEDAPLIPFSQGKLYAVTRPNIEGIYLAPTMLLPYYTIYARAPLKITATLGIHPQALNLRSKGRWITAYIELPEGHDVNDIDVSTIKLNNTVSVDPYAPTEIGDYDEDGIQDLMVKFDRVEVITIVNVGSVTLTITGEVNGIPFEGIDTIRVVDE